MRHLPRVGNDDDDDDDDDLPYGGPGHGDHEEGAQGRLQVSDRP